MAPLAVWPSSYHHRDAAERVGYMVGEIAQLAGPAIVQSVGKLTQVAEVNYRLPDRAMGITPAQRATLTKDKKLLTKS